MFQQRFTSVSGCKPQASLAPGERQQGGCYYYDNITAHSLDAAARHGRTLAMMYDISGCGDDAWNRTSADWAHLVDDMKLTKHPRYLHHDGKPVLAVSPMISGES